MANFCKDLSIYNTCSFRDANGECRAKSNCDNKIEMHIDSVALAKLIAAHNMSLVKNQEKIIQQNNLIIELLKGKQY